MLSEIFCLLVTGGFDTFLAIARNYSTTELGAEDCATCGREAVKSLLRLFDELVKCDEEGVLKGVRKVIDVKPLVE